MATFDSLVGEHIFGCVPLKPRHPFDEDADGVCFMLDDTTYLVFEDPSDGYRSSAGPILSFDGAPYALGGDGGGYPEYLKEPVLCTHRTTGEDEYEDGADILEVRSKETGALIFAVGTRNCDDYYPSFVNSWTPEGLSANSKARIAESAQ
jgi:hypothetical protein